MREDQIRRMVRHVVYRTLGKSQSGTDTQIRSLVSESDVAGVARDGLLEVPAGALVTPLARQVAM